MLSEESMGRNPMLKIMDIKRMTWNYTRMYPTKRFWRNGYGTEERA